MLNVKKLNVDVEKKEILKDINLVVNKGEIHALMGRNGSGKSTFAHALMGSPVFEITSGLIQFEGKNILNLDPSERSEKGIFLSFQYPSEVSGVNISSYLRMIYNKKNKSRLSPIKFRELLKEKIKLLGFKEDLINRYLNDGFSGGEKKRMEMLQMLVLEPKLAILDEIDSGLDIDALTDISRAVNYLHEKNNMAVILITHYARILKYIKPDFVHIMSSGKMVKSGGEELAHELEEKGYSAYVKNI